MTSTARLVPGALGVMVLLTWGATTYAQAPPRDAFWRAVVVDGATETLFLLDPTDPKRVPVGRATPGFIFESNDASRLVFVRSESRATTATIFSRAPFRTVGPVSLGADCPLPNLGANAGPSAGVLGRLRAQLLESQVVANVHDRLILSCRGVLVSLNLDDGSAVVESMPMQPAPIQSSRISTALRLLDARRVLAVSAAWTRPFTTELGIFDARTLAVEARIKVDGQLQYPALVSGGREIVLIDLGDESSPSPQPTRLRYFDPHTLAETRTVSLGSLFRVSRMSADDRFVYATNMDRNVPKQTARELRVLRADTGEVLERVELLEHASWFAGDGRQPAMIEDRRFKEPALSRLLVLDEGRVRARLPMHDFAHQVSVDRERGRMYVLDARSLAVYTWPDLQLEKQIVVGTILDWNDRPFMSLGPDGTRALVVWGSRAVVVDLVTGTALPEARLGSSGKRAGRFWASVGKASLVILGGGVGPVGSTGRSALAGSPFDPVPVAFSADARFAMLPAPTGQMTTIEMATGRAVRHVPGGDGAIAFASVPLVIVADKESSQVLSVATGDVAARFAVPIAAADARLSASVSPDGRLVLIGRGAAVHLLDAATGQLVQEWTGFGRVGAVHFLRDAAAQ